LKQLYTEDDKLFFKELLKQRRAATGKAPEDQAEVVAPLGTVPEEETFPLKNPSSKKSPRGREHKKSSCRHSNRSFSNKYNKRAHIDIGSSSAKDFLNRDKYLSEKVFVPLSSSEKEFFMSTSPSELASSFLELSASALVLGKHIGSVLKEREGANIEGLKVELVES